MSTINTLFTVSLIIAFNFIYSINGGTLCPASDCPNKSFCAGKDDGNYQNPSDDNDYPQTCFISCVGEQNLYCMSCPANLVYDPASDSCDYPPTATNEQPQGAIRRLLNGEDGSNCPVNSFCSGKSDGNYQNPAGYPQTYYISCDMAGNLYCMACPANLVYDPASDKCDYPASRRLSNEVNKPASMVMAQHAQDGQEPNEEWSPCLCCGRRLISATNEQEEGFGCPGRRLMKEINGNNGESPVTATNEQEPASIVMAQQSETEGNEEPNEEWSWSPSLPRFPPVIRRLINAINGNDGDESDATTEGQQPEAQEGAGQANEDCVLTFCWPMTLCCA